MSVRLVGHRGLTMTPRQLSGVAGRRSGQHQMQLETGVEGQRLHCDLGSQPKIKVTLADVALVREHFGANNCEAIRIALHLTAQAIRKNRAHVDVIA